MQAAAPAAGKALHVGEQRHKGDPKGPLTPARLLNMYLALLKTHPLATKSATSATISALGPVIQYLISAKKKAPIPWRQIAAFGLVGGAYIGPLTHHFYILLDQLIPASSLSFVKRILVERLCFNPPFLFGLLFLLNLLQGGSASKAIETLKGSYLGILKANFKIWTVPQIINLTYVPLKYRVVFANCFALLWNTYLAAC